MIARGLSVRSLARSAICHSTARQRSSIARGISRRWKSSAGKDQISDAAATPQKQKGRQYPVYNVAAFQQRIEEACACQSLPESCSALSFGFCCVVSLVEDRKSTRLNSSHPS